jgi:sodium-dependent phosphate cotransporter
MMLRTLLALIAFALFFLGLTCLQSGTETLRPLLRKGIPELMTGPVRTLAVAWLVTYVVMSGTLVAALSLTLYKSAIISPLALFLMICGSRLGAAAIVVLIGGLDYLQKKRLELRKAISLGLLTFLVTHVVYLPVTVAGSAFIYLTGNWEIIESPLLPASNYLPPIQEGLIQGFMSDVGPALTLVAGGLMIWGGLHLLSKLLETIDLEQARRKYFRYLKRPWLSLLVGFLLTMVSTSVTFSIGIVVPMYNRHYIKRTEMIPFILGANIGTLADTLLAALFLNCSDCTEMVLYLFVLLVVTTGLIMMMYSQFDQFISSLHDYIKSSGRTILWFLASLVIIPLLMLFI